MRLVRFGKDQTGAVIDGAEGPTMIDLDITGSWESLIEGWAELGPDLIARTKNGNGGVPLDGVRVLPPLISARARIFALGANFASHVAAGSKAVGLQAPKRDPAKPPGGFFVIPGTVIGPEEEIRPPADAHKLDYEAEVAVVLASGGRHLAAEEIRFWGHTAFNDVSIRDPHLGLSRIDEGALSLGRAKELRRRQRARPVDLNRRKGTTSARCASAPASTVSAGRMARPTR